jgi:hypothetical protein
VSHLRLSRYASATKFLAASRGFLLEHETENTLPLALTGALERNWLTPKQPAYFGAVEDAGRVVAAALMTPPQQAVLAWSEHEEAVRMLAGDVWSFRLKTPGVHGIQSAAAWFADAWSALTSIEPSVNMSERLYALERVKPVSGVTGHPRLAQPGDWPLLARWVTAFQREALPHQTDAPGESDVLAHWERLASVPAAERGQWVWVVAGDPVSYAAYGSPTPNTLRIGPVYTPPEQRGHGYARALTAVVSQTILDQGKRQALLYTDLANPTSNKLYQQVGYHPVADFDEYAWP